VALLPGTPQPEVGPERWSSEQEEPFVIEPTWYPNYDFDVIRPPWYPTYEHDVIRVPGEIRWLSPSETR
jgi:hypothetical protein